jgi:hypothetical protein
MEFTKQFNNAEFLIKRISYRAGRAIYTVQKIFGSWPTAQELIILCENGNFGGHADICNENMAIVDVYTD